MLNQRLAEVRKSKALSQSEFANRLGIKAGAYKTYELGLSKLPVPILQKLIDEFDVDAHWLLTGSKRLSNDTDLNELVDIIEAVLNFNEKNDLNFSHNATAKLISALFSSYLKHGSIEESDIKTLAGLVA